MKHVEKVTPVAAALTSLATLVCCLPMGFAAAAATACIGMVVAAYQRWFPGASVVLLVVGRRLFVHRRQALRHLRRRQDRWCWCPSVELRSTGGRA